MAKTRTLASLSAVAAICLAFSGCMARIMDFTLISTKNVNIPGERGARVQGEDMADIVIIIPTGQPNIKTAVDRAIENGHGDMLIDGVVSMKSWYIPYVFGQTGFVVEGTVVDTSKAGKWSSPAVARGAPAVVSQPATSSFSGTPAPSEPPVAVSSYGAASAPSEVSAAAPPEPEAPAPSIAHPAPVSQAQADAELLP